MKLGDPEYNAHFVNMVEQGLICGLQTPQEWLRGYARCIGISYTEQAAVNEFIFIASDRFYTLLKMEVGTPEQIDTWLNNERV